MKKVEKLNDVSLAEVSGGEIDPSALMVVCGAIVSLVSAPVTLGLAAADLVCRNKANKNKENGNLEKAGKLEKASGVLNKLTVTTGTIGTAGLVICGSGIIYPQLTK